MRWRVHVMSLTLGLSLLAAGSSATAHRPRPKGRPGRIPSLCAEHRGPERQSRLLRALRRREICIDPSGTGQFEWRLLAQGHSRSVHLQLRPPDRRDHRRQQGREPLGGRYHGRVFLPGRIGTTMASRFSRSTMRPTPADLAIWPAAARVPQGDATEDLFDPVLRGAPSASQGDVWWLTWDGNPERLGLPAAPAGYPGRAPRDGLERPARQSGHPLFPVHDSTTSRPPVRPTTQPCAPPCGTSCFRRRRSSRPGTTRPSASRCREWYPITDAFLRFVADMDVGDANQNYASVNVPFALGYAYQHDFAPPAGWTFDPGIFSPPFFSGAGLAGMKYLRAPGLPRREVGLTLFGNWCGPTRRGRGSRIRRTPPSSIAISRRP